MKPQQLETWLSAERRSRDEEAEAALFDLFMHLPLPEPSADFADRVLTRIGVIEPADLRGIWRLLTMVTLILTSLIAAGLAPFVHQWVLAAEPAATIQAITDLGVSAIHLLVGFWALFAGFGEAVQSALRVVWVVVSSPQVQAAFTLSIGFVVLVSRWLVALISCQRNPGNAPI